MGEASSGAQHIVSIEFDGTDFIVAGQGTSQGKGSRAGWVANFVFREVDGD